MPSPPERRTLSLALRTPSIRIETPVMGKSLVGVEVPNPNPALRGRCGT